MDRLYLILFKIFRFTVLNTPKPILFSILNFLAKTIYLFDISHRKIAKINLDFAFNDELSNEEKEKIVKKCYKNLIYNLADFAKNQGISKEDLRKKLEFKNEDILKDAIKNREKIILITAHYGNWELIPLAIGAFFAPMSVVGRALESKSIDKIVKKNREQFNIKLLDKKGAAKGMINALKNGRIVGLLVDQNTRTKEGILIDFFGKKARHTPSASLLARRFNAKIIPVFITTNDYEKYTITFYEPIICQKSQNSDEDIKNCTQAQADITEKVIRKKPDEWFWFHKRWKNQYEYIYSGIVK
ncbi:lipid A biosynthesis lauroyl acyltransferase [Nitrosophilus kaiyonis]|uniref:lipid A biosynthesis lauroyl acyltransferase n=1 Tax=Nitrosophilus kaiyonis TaxID=2930200 RepID=UPI0024938BFA|nr:lipid A biosynthesis lauroyl acyltransferase [Nitrosophilus kaiyonis]